MSATDTGRRRIVLTPSRDDLLDAAFLVVLLGLALFGFRATYSGSGYLLAGVAGAVLRLVIAHLGNALRQPMIALGAGALVVFFLAGGAIALRGSAAGGFLPSGSTVRELSDVSVHGWRRLLTTLPPVDGTGALVALPYLLGMLGGVAGFAIARRVGVAAVPVVAPLLVLVAVILLGTAQPAARLWQGAVFGTVALCWIVVRAARLRPPVRSGSGRGPRIATVLALVVCSFGGAALVGPHVPGFSAHPRTVLRSYVHPPFDIGQYPSPLAGFRQYTKPAKSLYRKPLFTVQGLPAHTLVRIATLDAYDGLTWSATNDPDQPADTFQRVGKQIDDPARGTARAYTVTLHDAYDNVWLPDAGALTALTFAGPHADADEASFRYNLATGTGVVPDGLGAGDSYSAQATMPARQKLDASDQVLSGAAPSPDGGFLLQTATTWVTGAGTPNQQVRALAAHLYRLGKFTDGEHPFEQYLPGHSVNRLLSFTSAGQLTGDEEQFAATLALAANQLGIPARVVLGARLPASGTVHGRDVTAWVEVKVVDGTWRALLPDSFMNRNAHPQRKPRENQQQQSGQIIPPPARGRPHSDLQSGADAAARAHNVQHRKHRAAATGSGFTLPAWIATTGRWGGPPVLAIAAVCALLIGLKALRRRRRRLTGSPARRLAHGWLELVDHARDLGSTVGAARTRREQAHALEPHDLATLARSADARVFGGAEPDAEQAAQFWRDVDAARRRMSAAVGRRRRFVAAINPVSLRRSPRAAGGTS